MSIIAQKQKVNTKKIKSENLVFLYKKNKKDKYVICDADGNTVNAHDYGFLNLQELKDNSSFHYPNPKRKRTLKFRLYKDSAEIIIDNGLHPESKLSSSKRSSITKLSKDSVRRCKLVLESNINLFTHEAGCTYPAEFPLDGKIFKKHLKLLKMWFLRHGVKVLFWYIEFQRRGAPHIHFYLSCAVDKERFSMFWYKVVGSCDLKHLKSGTHISEIRDNQKMASYAIGHVGKTAQKAVPHNFTNVGRFWGCTNKAKVFKEYSFDYHSDNALEADMSSIVNEYDSMLNKWAGEDSSRKEFEFKCRGFIAWKLSEYVQKLIDAGHFDESKYINNPAPEKDYKKIPFNIIPSDLGCELHGYVLKDYKINHHAEANNVC